MAEAVRIFDFRPAVQACCALQTCMGSVWWPTTALQQCMLSCFMDAVTGQQHLLLQFCHPACYKGYRAGLSTVPMMPALRRQRLCSPVQTAVSSCSC